MWRRSCDALPEGDCMAWSRPPSATPAWLLMRRSQFAPPPGWWRSAFDRRGGWPGGTYVRSNHQQLGLKSMKNEGKHVSGPFPPAAGTARTPQDTAGARRPPRGHRCSTPGQAPGLDRIICSEAHPGTSMRRRSLGAWGGPGDPPSRGFLPQHISGPVRVLHECRVQYAPPPHRLHKSRIDYRAGGQAGPGARRFVKSASAAAHRANLLRTASMSDAMI